MILHARARQPEGPDRHDLVVRFSNDPEWTFHLRREELDGTLRNVDDGQVHFVIRDNPRETVETSKHVIATRHSDGIWVVRMRASFLDKNTRYQLDHLDNDGRRTTHAYGTITKEDGL